jgi:hypothetical protein
LELMFLQSRETSSRLDATETRAPET